MKNLLIAILVLCFAGNCFGLEFERQKNVATVLVFPLIDSTTTTAYKSGAGNPDSELDQWSDSGDNPDGFADCTNEATEIGATGHYYLIVTQGEMNEDYIVIRIQSDDALEQTLLIRTTIGDPLNFATTDDGGTINVTGGAVDTVSAATLADTDHTINSLTIDDDTGDAVTIITRGGNGHGLTITGNGTGEGLKATGGTTGHGIDAQGGASGGQGINAKANGGNGAGALFQGEGTGEGLDARGGITGHGIGAIGGATSGDGINAAAQANNDAGMELVKHGTGDDLDAEIAVNIWNALTNAYGGVGTYGQLLEDGIGGATAQQVWEYNISAITTAGFAGTVLNSIGEDRYSLNMEFLGYMGSLWASDDVIDIVKVASL